MKFIPEGGRYNGTKKANVYYEAGRVHNQEA